MENAPVLMAVEKGDVFELFCFEMSGLFGKTSLRDSRYEVVLPSSGHDS